MQYRKFLIGLFLVAFCVAGGCSSISREDHFTACKDPNCTLCHGTGTYKCPRCLGRGVEHCTHCDGRGVTVCSSCKGTGRKKGKRCSSCDGTGRRACRWCNGTRMKPCSKCGGDGLIRCGTTTHTWLCRKCGKRFNYPAKLCPECDKEK